MRLNVFLTILVISMPIFAHAELAQNPSVATEKPSALTGELGILQRKDGTGRVSDELSITVNDPRLNHNRATNIPLLVKGQVDVKKLLQVENPKPSDRQIEIAIARAAQRVAAGAELPSYDSVDAAVAAAKARSASRGREFSKGMDKGKSKTNP